VIKEVPPIGKAALLTSLLGPQGTKGELKFSEEHDMDSDDDAAGLEERTLALQEAIAPVSGLGKMGMLRAFNPRIWRSTSRRLVLTMRPEPRRLLSCWGGEAVQSHW
jgi:hypothetical protein